MNNLNFRLPNLKIGIVFQREIQILVVYPNYFMLELFIKWGKDTMSFDHFSYFLILKSALNLYNQLKEKKAAIIHDLSFLLKGG